LSSLTLDHIWLLFILALIWVFVGLTPLPPNDLWWHMAAGRTMVAEGTLMTTNRWAYTLPADAPYVYQSWLSQVLMYGLWAVGDVPLLALSRLVAITGAYGLVAWHALRSTGNGRAVAVALFVAAMTGWSNWTLRPQTLVLPLGALFVVAINEYREGRLGVRWLAALPATMLLWVNMHGSFVVGLGLVGMVWLGSTVEALRAPRESSRAAWGQWRVWAGATLATLAVTLANPLGLGIFSYLRDMLGNEPLQRWFVEWQPMQPSLNPVASSFWFYVLLLGLAALMAVSPRRPSASEVFWYCAFAWLALGGARYAMWFGLLLLPLFASQLTALMKQRRPVRSSPAFSTTLGLLFGGAVVATLPWFSPSQILGPEAAKNYASTGPHRMLLANNTPIAASEWLAQNPIEGRFWTDMSLSSYTIWQLPEKQVFADLRAELFPVAIWQDYFDIASGDSTSLPTIERWQITHLLLDTGNQASLHELLLRTPGWCERYADERAVVMARCQ
ncbi:MAG: hypothetical protein MUD01_20955, partial [Chloroflexaceae bacterium]|nr:hypothetical protein [Chloroflexaceae bacterium]